MVTKTICDGPLTFPCFILAKIHMVTKQGTDDSEISLSFILAKIHMVTKLCRGNVEDYRKFYPSKNPYGNKTVAWVS